MMKPYLLAVLLGLLCSCHKATDTIAPTAEPAWTVDSTAFLGTRVLLNGVARDDYFGAVGTYEILKYANPIYDPNPRSITGIRIGVPFSLLARPAISKNYICLVNPDQDYFVIASLANDILDYKGRLAFSAIDPAHYQGARAHSSIFSDLGITPIAAFNDQHQCLLAVSESSRQLSYALVSFRDENDQITVTATKRLVGQDRNTDNFGEIFGYKDRFFVNGVFDSTVVTKASAYNFQGTSILYGDGHVKTVPYYLQSFFQFRNQLYAINYGARPTLIYTSADDGETWQSTNAIYPDGLPWQQAHFTVLDDRLLIYYQSQLFELDIAGKTLREIKNNGLALNQITSVNKFGETVYVTTLSGLFKIPARDFWRFKS